MSNGTYGPPQPYYQYTATETYSENVVGPVIFYLSNLRVAGLAGPPPPPKEVAPSQSPYIIKPNEMFELSVDVKFNMTPLTDLLLCLGTKIKADFCLEGCGGKATEVDLSAMDWTEKGEYEYTLTFKGTPNGSGMTPGFYAIAAVVTVGPSKNECAKDIIFGCGYIAKVFLLVCEEHH